MDSDREMEEYMALLGTLVEDVTGPGAMASSPEASEHYKQAFIYNHTNMTPFLGQMTVNFYKWINPHCTPEQLRQSRILGWSLEIIKNSGVIIDDMLDNQKTREGKATWHTLKGSIVPIDGGFFLNAGIKIMTKYFKDKPYYWQLRETLDDYLFAEYIGVCADMMSVWREYTPQKCRALNATKGTVYMCVPVACAMILSGMTAKDDLEAVSVIFRYLGHWQQDQNDFVDAFGEELGTDIQEGRCTWLFGEAQERSTPDQLNTLRTNYGQTDERCVQKVLNLYKELNLKEVFEEQNVRRKEEVLAMIDGYKGALPKHVMKKFLQDIVSLKYA